MSPLYNVLFCQLFHYNFLLILEPHTQRAVETPDVGDDQGAARSWARRGGRRSGFMVGPGVWLAWQPGQRECCLSLGLWVRADATEGGRKGGEVPAGGASVIGSVGQSAGDSAEPRSEPGWGRGFRRERRSEGAEEQPGALGPSGWNPVVTSDSDSSGVWARPLASKFSKRKLLKPNLGHEMLCKEGNS